MNNQDGIELRWIFAVIRRWWWLILSSTLLTLGLTYTLTSRMPPVYEASATLLVQPSQDTNMSEYNVLVVGERLALTYTEMLKGQPIMEAVIAKLELEDSIESLSTRITAIPISDTQLIHLSVKDSSPVQAALLANTIAEEFTTFIQGLNTKRYATSLESIQERIDGLSTTITKTQSHFDQQSVNQIEAEADLTRQEDLLVEYRDKHRALEQDYTDFNLLVDQLKGEVKVVEAAHVPESDFRPPYSATVTLLMANEQLGPTYMQMLAGRTVLAAAIAQLGISDGPEIISERVIVEPVVNTQLIRLSVYDNDAAQASLLADTIANLSITQIQDLLAEPYKDSLENLQSQMAQLTGTIKQTEAKIEKLILAKITSETELTRLNNLLGENRTDLRSLQQEYEQLLFVTAGTGETVTVTEPATLPSSQGRNRVLFISLGFFVGVVLGLGIAFLLEYLDDTIKTPIDVNRLFDIEVIGTIPKVRKKDGELIVVSKPRGSAAESFRMLRNKLQYLGEQQPLRSILISSPNPDEGKSVVASNLAITIAASGQKVLLVEADLHLPSLHEIFDLNPKEGLTDFLINGKIEGRTHSTKFEGLSILAVGGRKRNTQDGAIGTKTIRKLLEQLSESWDVIVLDGPPVLPVADATALASSVDGMLLVFKSGRSRSADTQRAVQTLQQVGANIIGIVLNAIPSRVYTNNYSYHEYYRRSANDRSEQTSQVKPLLPTVQRWFQNK